MLSRKTCFEHDGKDGRQQFRRIYTDRKFMWDQNQLRTLRSTTVNIFSRQKNYFNQA